MAKQDLFKDPRTPAEIRAQETAQQALASKESGGQMHRPPHAGSGNKWEHTDSRPRKQSPKGASGNKWGAKK